MGSMGMLIDFRELALMVEDRISKGAPETQINDPVKPGNLLVI